MFAITCTGFSTDDPLSGLTLGEHPDPEPPPGWEVVEVRAASLNHHDLWSLKGVGLAEERLPVVLGCDAAGVTGDGREVIVHGVIEPPHDSRFSILSERFDGTFAERVAVPSENLIDKPDSLSWEEAACLPTAWLTAYRMLFTKGEVTPGQRILVQGAGGGVSTALLLLARAAGVHVTVTSRSEDKLERARELGANLTLASGERLPHRVDAVMETVGDATWGHSLRSLVPGGRIVVAGSTSGPNPPAELNRVFYLQLQVIGSTMGTRDELERLVRFLDVSGVRPLWTTYALSDARDAFATDARGGAVRQARAHPLTGGEPPVVPTATPASLWAPQPRVVERRHRPRDVVAPGVGLEPTNLSVNSRLLCQLSYPGRETPTTERGRAGVYQRAWGPPRRPPGGAAPARCPCDAGTGALLASPSTPRSTPTTFRPGATPCPVGTS
jgi:NADPH:quinone reductase-like Zn-dependent oxidoreductase